MLKICKECFYLTDSVDNTGVCKKCRKKMKKKKSVDPDDVIYRNDKFGRFR